MPMLKIKVDKHGPYIKLREFCEFIEHLSHETESGEPINSWNLEEKLKRRMKRFGGANLPHEVHEMMDGVYEMCRKFVCPFCEDQDPNPECNRCWGERFFDNTEAWDQILQRMLEINFDPDSSIRVVI